jgi:spermidine synthase
MHATRSTHAALFCLSASVLMLEVALTRVFSVMLWSHYTFMVISTALLGFGAAGALLSVRPGLAGGERIRRSLSRHSLAFALTTLAAVMASTRLGFDPTRILASPADTLKLCLVYLLTAIPFFFAGTAICRLLTAAAAQVNTIYFADLVGGGMGALTVTFFLNWIGAPATVVASSILAVLAGLLFGGFARRRTGLICAAALGLLLVLVTVRDPWRIPVAPTKSMHNLEDHVAETRWSLHGRVDILDDLELPLSFGSGVSEELLGRRAFYRTLFIDGTNPSRLIKYDQDRWFVRRMLTAGPYHIGLQQPKVLIIGSGGGVDVLVSEEHGRSAVTAVEINPATVGIVSREYSDYIGGIFNRPDVTLLSLEGRHFLTLDRNRYDLIRLTGVDTRAASAIGANALDDVYLYTVEAIGDFYRHLTPDGVLAISRVQGWETARLVNIMVRAFELAGGRGIEDRVAVVDNGRWSDVMLRRRPFTREEINTLGQWAERSRLQVLYDPFGHRGGRTLKILTRPAEEREASYRLAQRNLRPVTDDSPFFFEMQTLGQVLGNVARLDFRHSGFSGYLILLVALAQAALLAALFILFPLWRNRGKGEHPRGMPWVLAYFSLLGLGFIMAELVFIQKFTIILGGPAPSMAITLFSILVFSGLGAFFARRVPLKSAVSAAAALAVVFLLLGLSMIFLRWGLPLLLGFGFPMRVLLSVASLAPVCFTLGFPFPLGIRLLDRGAPRLIPWAWAGNSCFTVIGSVLCVIVSMNWGYSTALALAAFCYLAATPGIFLLARSLGGGAARPSAT